VPTVPISIPQSPLVKLLAAGCCLLLRASPLQAQDTPIFPDLYGDDLLDALFGSYKPGQTLSYGDAKDELFGEIDNHQDSLTCVYTGLTIYIDPGSDPSSYAESRGINTEHTWPQSKGASGQARADMHHLFPTRDVTNSARGSLAFGEVYDPHADRWWRLDYDIDYVPFTHIDEYSEEQQNVRFEPREDHKGNVARAMFYFYTMYQEQADSADPYFFSKQKSALRDWHALDPVDAWEATRTELIAVHQDQKPNPFVVDTTLVRRAYFWSPSGVEDDAGGREAPPSAAITALAASPNPFNPRVSISYSLAAPARITIEIHDLSGRLVDAPLRDAPRPAGEHRLEWHASALASGVYRCRLSTRGGSERVLTLMLLR